MQERKTIGNCQERKWKIEETEIYHALGSGLSGENIAVKLSTGEPPASNYLDPDLIADLVHEVDGTIVENNTAYGGQRASTAIHGFQKILWEPIFRSMTAIWFFPILKGMPWQVLEALSKIFPSGSLLRRGNA